MKLIVTLSDMVGVGLFALMALVWIIFIMIALINLAKDNIKYKIDKWKREREAISAEWRVRSMIEKIAKMLGVELYEEFKIKPTKMGEIMGVKPCEKIFRFDTELVYKGEDDGWSEWYGFGCDKILYYLILGKYKIVKGE